MDDVRGMIDWSEAVKSYSGIAAGGMTIVHVPKGLARCRPKKKRLRKKLESRHFVRHFSDLKYVLVHEVTGAYPKDMHLFMDRVDVAIVEIAEQFAEMKNE